MKFQEIIFFYPSFEKGGVENIIKNLIQHSLKLKIKIHLVSTRTIVNKKKLSNFSKVKKYKNRFYTSLFSIFNLIKILLINFKRRKKICLFSLQSNSLAIICGKILGYKVVIRNSEYPLGSLSSFDDNIIKAFIIFFQKIILYNFTDLIISNSKGSRDTIKKFIINKRKVIFIYNPYIRKILKENLKYKKNIILFVGRFAKQKGIIYLLKAFSIFVKKYSTFELWLVGSGPEKKLINQYINQNKIKNKTKIIPWTNNLKKIYLASKYFVLPSVYEGLGNVVIEALNYSRICIVSNCKHGPSEILNNGKGGYIFKSRNHIDLFIKLDKIENNYEIAQKKIKYGRKQLNRFLINNQSTKYIKAIQNI
jgi:glycosyltransferase involved in cell wall biosynthesis